MPKFIGKTISFATRIQDNANQTNGMVKLQFSQARLLPANMVYCSLDTSDRGGIKRFARRWYRWFAPVQFVLNYDGSTKSMIQRANKAQTQ